MTDRELLELAAKAAGLRLVDWRDDWADFGPGWRFEGDDGMCNAWNPLTDDGDALRLAVKLNIHISLYGPDVGITAWVISDERSEAHSFDEDYGDAHCASVRRAIVRAAAYIGRAMP